MANPVAIVTGGSRGIGAATARTLAAHGYDVVVSYLSDEVSAATVVAAIEEAGRRGLAVRADCGREADIARIFAAVDDTFGRLDLLVNNAATAVRYARIDEVDGDTLRRVAEVNLVGPMLCAREALRRMSTRHGGKGGVIVNVSSTTSESGSAGDFVYYAATKGGINSFTVGLAREVAAEGVRVNAVSPGPIATEVHARLGRPDLTAQRATTVPMGRVGEVQEVAEAICWLASPAASFVTGANLRVAGGK